MMSAHEIRRMLEAAELSTPGHSLIGLGEDEIAQLEHRAGFAFPAQYGELLRAIGRDAQGFFVGTDLFWADLTDAARDMMMDDPVQLPGGSWVFSMHQGYQFDFFICDGNDDPPVHKWVEFQGLTFDAWPSLSDWIVKAVDWHLRIRNRE